MTRIVADTTSSLPHATFKALDIDLIPQIVVFGEESFRDDTELDTAAFLGKLKSASQLPKTAAPPPLLYNPIFERALVAREAVVVIAPSARVSGTVRSAETAAQDFPDLKVHVVDSQTIAGNLATLVLLAKEWANAGVGAEEIVTRLRAWIPRQRTYFLVNTLEYLQKGGRIGGAKALVGELLQVKPILCVRAGQVEAYEQQRTKKRALARLVEIVVEQCPRDPASHLCLMQGDALVDAQALAADLKSRLGLNDIPIYEMPPAIVVHGGPGVLGVAFFAA